MERIDRRKYFRLQIRMPISVEGLDSLSQPFTEETETINVSLEGASFPSRMSLAVGQLVTLSVRNKCRVHARITWVRESRPDGLREVGCNLVPPVLNWVVR